MQECSSQETTGTVAVLVVQASRHPVLFKKTVNPLASSPCDFKREEDDEQMRCRFRDLRQFLAIPILRGVSAISTRLSFYEYDSVTHVVQRERVIQSHPLILADMVLGL
jgi:hypothetical protein